MSLFRKKVPVDYSFAVITRSEFDSFCIEANAATGPIPETYKRLIFETASNLAKKTAAKAKKRMMGRLPVDRENLNAFIKGRKVTILSLTPARITAYDSEYRFEVPSILRERTVLGCGRHGLKIEGYGTYPLENVCLLVNDELACN